MNENYYLVLELPIDRFVSGQEAMDELEKKLKKWNASASTSERNKKEKYEKPVREAISNAAEWEKLYQDAKAKIIEKITSMINANRGKGYLTNDEIAKMKDAVKIRVGDVNKKYKVDESLVRSIIQSKGIPVRDAEEKRTRSDRKLEDYRSEEGEKSFNPPSKSAVQLGCEDFYQFLNRYQVNTHTVFSETTAAAACVAAASAIEDAWKARKENAEKSAVQSVCTCIRVHFAVSGDKQNQQEYNKYLLYKKIKSILDELQNDIGNVSDTKMLYLEQKGVYINRIVELVQNRDDAESILENYCKEKKIAIQQKVALNSMCPFCNSIFEKKEGKVPDACPVCRRSFLLTCPKCHKPVNFAEKNSCCGFNFDQYPRLARKCEDASRLIAGLQFGFAESQVQEIEKAWAGFPLLKDIRQELDSQKKKFGTIVAELETSIREKRYFAARKTYQQLRNTAPGYQDELLQTEISDALKKADETYREATQAKDANTRLQKLIKVTEYVADHADAVRELGSIKPEPVSSLLCSAVQNAGCVNLEWKSSNPEETAVYVILRKAYSKPVSTEDGKLAQTSEKAYCDRSPDIGVPYFYAVFAIRGSSKTALCTSPEPCLLFPEIRSANVLPDEKSIRVTWDTDVHGMQAEVFRSETPGMTEYGKGTPVQNVTSNSFTDEGLQVGVKYYYQIFLTLETGGKKRISPPFSISASPIKISKPMDFTLIQDEDTCRMELKAEPDADEEIAFYQSERSIIIPNDGITTVQKLTDELKLTPIKVTKESARVYRFKAEKNSKGYIYVVSVRGETAVIGHDDYYENLEMLAVKAIKSDGMNLHLELEKWPAGCNILTIAYRDDRYPSTVSDAGGTKFTVNERDYRSRGIVVPSGSGACWIAGFVRGGNGYSTVFRAKYGTEQQIGISYYFTKGGLLSKKKLILTLTEKAELPEMTLCYRDGFIPAAEVDGQQLLEIQPTGAAPAKRYEFVLPPLPNTVKKKRVFGKLFLKDKSLSGCYQLMIAEGHTAEL